MSSERNLQSAWSILRALFLDRDGVINRNHGYVYSPARFEFLPGIFDLVRAANLREYIVVVVTNQSGIARGFYTERDFLALSGWMRAEFEMRGARIDAIYHCPHHPEHGVPRYKMVCTCRKPAPGMFLQAARELNIDVDASVMIGDSPSDLEAAQAAGVGRRLLFDERPQGRDDVTLHALSDYDRIFGACV